MHKHFLSRGALAQPVSAWNLQNLRFSLSLIGSQIQLCQHDFMGMMKNYLLRLLEQCSEEKFGQDAIEWAIVTGLVSLTYDFDRDVRESMSRYDEIIEAYRRSVVRAEIEVSKPHAPMQRADPGRRTKAGNSSVKAKHAA